MAAAVCKMMRNQDLIAVGAQVPRGRRAFRNTIGLAGPAVGAPAAQPPDRRPARHRRLDPRRPADGLRRRGDRHQPGHATASTPTTELLRPDRRRCAQRFDIPTQSCVLTHVTNTMRADRARRAGRPGVPVDRRHGGGQPQLRRRSRAAARGARRGPGSRPRGPAATTSCTSRPARARRCRPTRTTASTSRRSRRAPMRSRGRFEPLLVNTRRRLHRPGISLRRQADHPRRAGGPLLRQAARPADGGRRLLHQPRRGRSGRHGRPADPAGGVAGVNFVMGVPGADDVMLNYQSTSFHDALYRARSAGPAPRAGVRGLADPDGAHRRGRSRARSPRGRRAPSAGCSKRQSMADAASASRSVRRASRARPPRASAWAARARACPPRRCWRFSSPMRGRATRCTRPSTSNGCAPPSPCRRSSFKAPPPIAQLICRIPGSAERLSADAPALPRGDFDVAFVVADGLSVVAVHAHAADGDPTSLRTAGRMEDCARGDRPPGPGGDRRSRSATRSAPAWSSY